MVLPSARWSKDSSMTALSRYQVTLGRGRPAWKTTRVLVQYLSSVGQSDSLALTARYLAGEDNVIALVEGLNRAGLVMSVWLVDNRSVWWHNYS